MRVLRLLLSYDGREFAGWQRQAEARTVQAVLEEALVAIEGRPVVTFAAGRTDAGVHAMGQVVSVEVQTTLGADTLRRAINVRLPPDVRVRTVADAPAGFNARFHAVSKTYRYAVVSGGIPSPFLRHVVWHVPQGLDVAAMTHAATLLVGEHDFASFQGRGSTVVSTVRRILSSTVEESALGPHARLVRYEVTGTGFLRHMVRVIVGTLVGIGRGRWQPDEMRSMLVLRDRRKAGPTAPPQGLTLWRVRY